MLQRNRVWVTGVVPIGLDLSSDFKPINMSFMSKLSGTLGFREHDVDYMLNCVHCAQPFRTDQEKKRYARPSETMQTICIFCWDPHYTTPVR